MSTEEITNPTTQRQSPALRLPNWLGRRRLWVLAGFAAVATGLALNWGWLTAVGAVPVQVRETAPRACEAGLEGKRA